MNYSEHVLRKRRISPGGRTGSRRRRQRLVRIFFTDEDATDSSSGDEDGATLIRQRAKRHIHEIGFEVGSTKKRRRKVAAVKLMGEKAVMKYPLEEVRSAAIAAGSSGEGVELVAQYDCVGYSNVDAFGISSLDAPLCLTEFFSLPVRRHWEVEFGDFNAEDFSLEVVTF